MMSLTDTERGFIAGILQREGSFMQNLSNRKYHYPRLTLSSTDEWLIDHLIATTGIGKKRVRGPRDEGFQTSYLWDVTRQEDVRELAVEILPLLGKERKEKILE